MRTRRRDRRRRALSEVAARRARASSTTPSAIRNSRRRSPSISRRSGPAIRRTSIEMIERANQLQRHCAPTAPVRTRAAGRCSSAKPAAARWTTTATPRCAITRCRWCGRVVEGMLASEKLDAIVYPTSPRRPALISAPPEPPGGGRRLADQHRQPDRLPRSDRAGRIHRRRSAGRHCRSSARRSASRSCWRSATASSSATHARRLPVHTPRATGRGRCESGQEPRLSRIEARPSSLRQPIDARRRRALGTGRSCESRTSKGGARGVTAGAAPACRRARFRPGTAAAGR